MKSILNKIQEIAEQLLKKHPLPYEELKNIPKTQGVYLVYNTKGVIIYVGKGKVLRRRIKDDHISGETKFTTSILRRKISKAYSIKSGQEMRDWMVKNCLFAWIEITSHDETSLVEDLLIAHLRNKRDKAALLND